MSKVKVYSRFDVPKRVQFDTGTDSIVDKASAKFADINFIVKNYSDAEIALMGNGINQPIYGDYTKQFTYQDVFDLRENLQVLYDELSDDKVKDLSFDAFVNKLNSSSDDDLLSLLGKNIGSSTHTESNTSAPVGADVSSGPSATPVADKE